MNYPGGSNIYNVDIYTCSNRLMGEVCCPSGLRLLDLFNGSSKTRRDFVEFINVYEPDEETVPSGERKSYLRKDSIQFLAISEANQGRGIGAKGISKSFPFVPKTPLAVSMHLQNYRIIGSLHLIEGQTMQNLLYDEKQFIPLTDATIKKEKLEIGKWPFVIVNKNYLILLREKQNGNIVP